MNDNSPYTTLCQAGRHVFIRYSGNSWEPLPYETLCACGKVMKKDKDYELSKDEEKANDL